MPEERITERTDAAGNVTERIIERGDPSPAVVGVATPVAVAPASTGGGMSGFIIVILLAVLAVGGLFDRIASLLGRCADIVGCFCNGVVFPVLGFLRDKKITADC